MNANELISRMTDIESEMKMHEGALADLRAEGQGLFAEFESWRSGLAFGSLAAPNAKAAKGEDNVSTGLKLAIKRAIQKAKDSGSSSIEALTLGEATALRFVEKKGVSMPNWVAEWTERFIGKVYPQPQVETPVVAEADETKQAESAGADESPKPTKKRKK